MTNADEGSQGKIPMQDPECPCGILLQVELLPGQAVGLTSLFSVNGTLNGTFFLPPFLPAVAPGIVSQIH